VINTNEIRQDIQLLRNGWTPHRGQTADKLELMVREIEELRRWREAVENELVVCEQTVDSYPTPTDAVRGLISWHCSVALDPLVSSSAAALIDQGRQLASHL